MATRQPQRSTGQFGQNQNKRNFVSGGMLNQNSTAPAATKIYAPTEVGNANDLVAVNLLPNQHIQQPQGINLTGNVAPTQQKQPISILKKPKQKTVQFGTVSGEVMPQAVAPPAQEADAPSTEQKLQAEMNVNEDVEIKQDSVITSETNPVDVHERKAFFRRLKGIKKNSSVIARQKRIRRNRLMRRVLIPKNALMALHEIKGIRIENFQINDHPAGGFTATVTVNNIQYEGFGPSKNSAKNNACEKALRDLVISKMLNGPEIRLDRSYEDNITEGDVEMIENVDDVKEEEELPMVNLASFAIFKLFSEWEREGFEIPEFRNSSTASKAINTSGSTSSINGGEKPKKQPACRKDLPPNWEQMHPASLLCMMRPGIMYVDLGCEGQQPNSIQKIGVAVEDQNFIGTARSKKAARRDAAVNACNSIFGTNFNRDSSAA